MQDADRRIDEIVSLDPDNKAGLKAKYGAHELMVEARTLLAAGKADEAQAVLDRALAVPGLPAEKLQSLHIFKGITYLGQGELDKARGSLQKGLDVAPQGPRAKLARSGLQKVDLLTKVQSTSFDVP
jgi:tetratricopeptide (TPR) repeat protein